MLLVMNIAFSSAFNAFFGKPLRAVTPNNPVFLRKTQTTITSGIIEILD
jgi:hypothetical protein